MLCRVGGSLSAVTIGCHPRLLVYEQSRQLGTSKIDKKIVGACRQRSFLSVLAPEVDLSAKSKDHGRPTFFDRYRGGKTSANDPGAENRERAVHEIELIDKQSVRWSIRGISIVKPSGQGPSRYHSLECLDSAK